MTNQVIQSIISDTCYIIITSILGVIGCYVKMFIAKHSDFIEHQKEVLQKQLGIEQYNQDVSIAKILVKKVQEEASSYNWDNEMKHSKAVEYISAKTGLSSEDIYDVIKGAVTKIKSGKAS
jgi:hypothetical protein